MNHNADDSTKLRLCPITLKEANTFVAAHHRHHRPAQGGLFAVAVTTDFNGWDRRICGVAIIGRPVARRLADGYTAEVTRVATDGTRNACSVLHGACWRAARAIGYRKLVTYTIRPRRERTSTRARDAGEAFPGAGKGA